VKILACVAAVTVSALAASGCARSVGASQQSSTDALRLHESWSGDVSPALRNFIRSTIAVPDGPMSEIDVYGPDTRAALVKAASGDIAVDTPRQQNEPFYLIVLHGKFACGVCPVPPGTSAPQGTIEWRIWSHGAAAAGMGVTSNLPAAVSLLNRVAVIQLS
jgi:hypothetical protein